MAAAMSIHCMRMPPNIVPWVLVSPGSTTCAVSTLEALGDDGGGPASDMGSRPVTRGARPVNRVCKNAVTMRHLAILPTAMWFAAGLCAVPSAAAARTYNLAELIDLAKRNNPGVAAAVEQTEGVQALLLEANRSWLPTGELLTLLAPAPEVRCQTDLPVPSGADAKTWREEHCERTNIREASVNLSGVFSRTELRFVQPVYTFGKISAGVSAARAGIAASRSREQSVLADLELNVKRAYWTVKLAREILEALGEGREHVEEGQKTVDEGLKKQSGSVTVIDRHRLQTVRAEVEARILEAGKLGEVARGGLLALLGPEAPKPIEIDPEPLDAVEVPARAPAQYQEHARLSRPEVRALDHLVASKRALADLERRKQLPDVVIMGTATFAFTSSIDNPRNAFYSDPFNTLSAGLAAGLRVPLDLGVKNARAVRLRAEAEETYHRRREALGGIAFEVERAYQDLVEAQQRLKVMRDGEKAGKAWVNTVAQNFSAGLAEAKDFADALSTYFQFRIRALQAVFDTNMSAATLSRAVGGDVTR